MKKRIAVNLINNFNPIEEIAIESCYEQNILWQRDGTLSSISTDISYENIWLLIIEKLYVAIIGVMFYRGWDGTDGSTQYELILKRKDKSKI